MTSQLSYFEQYLENLRGLPGEVQRNFNMLYDLDKKVQGVTKDVEKREVDYLSKARTLSRRDRLQSIRSIKDQLKLGRSLADQKVQLAVQTYDLVDKHIRQLDSDLSRLEGEIKESIRKNAHNQVGGDEDTFTSRGRKKSFKRGMKQSRKSMGEAGGNSGSCGRDESPSSAEGHTSGGIPASASLVMALTNNPSEVLDMPVDPNEPTYCLCHQVSYGEMVGCDNTDCPIEWFHFGCVGLVEKPKGKWYCPRCLDQRRKTGLHE